MQNFSLSEAISERLQSVEEEMGAAERVLKLECDKIDIWEHRNQSEFASSRIEELGSNILTQGQFQPVIVVQTSTEFKPKNDIDAKYVLVTGHRRWLACKNNRMPVQALVKYLNLEQAVNMIIYDSLNDSKSDYSKGLLCHALLKTGVVDEDKLSSKLRITRPTLQKLLAFNEFPEDLILAINDFSKVSANTAVAVLQFVKKGPEYKEAILAIGDKIAEGYGITRIKKLVSGILDFKVHKKTYVSPKSHRLRHKGKVLMKTSYGSLNLDESIVNHEDYDDLLGSIDKQVIGFYDMKLDKK
jgi:ParB family chromosome partitioning protein